MTNACASMVTGRMSRYRIRLGERGEAIARRYLQRRGYRILARNWRTRRGEIDLVARKGGIMIFVEVKTRSSHDFGRPEEAVTARKQSKLIGTAQAYLQSHGAPDAAWRIDVIAVDIDRSGAVSRIEHFEDVVQMG